MRATRFLAAALLAAVAGAVAPTTARAFARPPSLAAACGGGSGIRARPLWLRTSDRVRLYAIEAGRGRVTVVLAHEGNGDLCEELAYAKTLLAAGLRVLAFDFRGDGESGASARHPTALGRDLAAAVAQARRDGGRRVFLVGASMGGAAAVNNGAGLRVAGVISLSGTVLWPGFGVNVPGARALTAPFLYLGSRDDWRAPVRQALAIFHRVRSPDKRIVLYPGSLHGWDLVQAAPFAARARALILAWIAARSAGGAG
jgi:alpha-beta hydrolase superfamily lysophospholipase